MIKKDVVVLQKGQWLKYPDLPRGLFGHCMAVTESRVLVTGGALRTTSSVQKASFINKLPPG